MNNDPLKRKTNVEKHPLLVSRLNALHSDRPFSLEPAAVLRGVQFVNDSAATSLEQVAVSLSEFETPVIWIAEINEADADFNPLSELLGEKVKAIIAVGAHANDIHLNLKRVNGLLVSAASWEESIDLSLDIARANDTVLFSPGARSGQPFENYRERGAYFNRLLKIKNNSNM